MAVTIYDIAREAKVGIGTVSRVLNNSPKVTDATREKVITVAQRLNYQPHAFAQALARKRSNTLSAVIPFFTNYFFIEVLQGVQETLASLGYDLIIHGVTSKEQMEEYLLRTIKKGRVDGALVFSLPISNEFAQEFIHKKIPLVLVDTFHKSFDSIRIDNMEGARIATEHLISLGHKNIGMINANMRSVPARERLKSFIETLIKHGVEVRDDFIAISAQLKNDGFSREAGYESAKELLSRNGDFPTAIFVSSDIQAIGVLTALEEHNLHIPRDISVVSFDNIELSKYFGLTTMQQPMYKMGELAVRKILDRIEQPEREVTMENFTPSLVVRATCGANKNYSIHSN